MINVRVQRKTLEAIGICSYELARADGGLLPAFTAGSHIDVHLPSGLVRQYSLVNDSDERHRYRIAVLRDEQSRGGSSAMHELVQEGDPLAISEPRNHFPLVQAKKSVLLAGGIGITPLVCMARRLEAAGAEFSLHYCARSRERTAFRREMEEASFAARVQFHFDDGAGDQKLDLDRVLTLDPDTRLYVCGPQGFIEWIIKAAETRGWLADQIHKEYFGAKPRATPTDRAFEVTIASSGTTLAVPADKSVVQALRDHGIEILTSCEQGVCGTCVTRVLAGECDHRDLYFTHEEKDRHDQFTPCCSRARSARLVLDL